MSNTVNIVGEVCYREGDGAMLLIRRGLCEIEESQADVTLGWQDGNNRLSTVMPRADFERFVNNGSIRRAVAL